jgi:hypothetical protein
MFIMFDIIAAPGRIVQRKIGKKGRSRPIGRSGEGRRGLGKKPLTLAPVPVVIVV